ncbi:peptidase domain-containing ABC transporter [Xinfangfangia pollutisoli]|uniref:peptidase domain-containing ABC transporter n=1 Tax=Xinfangfangia pollutisoli TaxID=2865960 RepID=UPI001CD1E479|nr:peptidase domain-containing ABC transporter [Xinfangfangia pollutisoli]
MSAEDPTQTRAMEAQTRRLTGLRAAFLVASHHGVALRPEDLPSLVGPDMTRNLAEALERAGFRTRRIPRCSWATAAKLGTAYPALVPLRDGGWLILVLVVVKDGQPMAAVMDPAQESAGIKLVPQADFLRDWAGELLLVQPAPAAAGEHRPFGLAWFLPALAAQKALLAGVAVAVLTGNLISYSLPLMFQSIVDRVIAHSAWNTLYTIVALFLFLATFDAGFTYTRQRLMQIAGGKVDALVGGRTFAHLMTLPLSVFETIPAGVLTRHLQQTEKIRLFLTGRLFQTGLDAAFLPLLLGLLALISGQLTLVVLGFALAIALCIAALLPVFRHRLNALYAAEAERQAHLVETLHNMRAVKSLVLEGARRRVWEDSLAASLSRQWDVGAISALAGSVTGWLEKAMQISVVALGAAHVLDGQMTVGALVAFLMLSGRVSGPLVQIVGLINEHQEAALSVRMLKGVMDQRPEKGLHNRPAKHQISGRISFDQVSFTYPGANLPALDRISLDIPAGEIVGVVGRSGSGKTTLTRLIQGIEPPGTGLLQVDGVDIRQIDLDHLRRNIGVVLQENLLFRGTIRDNIAMARPGAAPEEVILAARLAGAEDFISRLPQGFETKIEEGGSNLSGGQRQRIAIARALMGAPRVLIFDEATSALDPESEQVVNRNLAAIAQGRTVVVVSHRLSSLVRADRIVVMDQGRVLDIGPHRALLDRCATYRQLWDAQTEHLT